MAQKQSDYIKVNTKPEFKSRVKDMAEKLDLPMGAVLRIAFDNYQVMIAQREKQNIPLLSDEMSLKVNQAYREIETGDYVDIRPDDDPIEILDNAKL